MSHRTHKGIGHVGFVYYQEGRGVPADTLLWNYDITLKVIQVGRIDRRRDEPTDERTKGNIAIRTLVERTKNRYIDQSGYRT